MHNLIRCGLCLVALAAMASEATAQAADTTLPAELGWVKFRISGGRLQIASPRYRESRTYESSNPLAGTSQSLRLNISSESAAVQYTQQSPQHVLRVEFESTNQVTIEQTPIEAGDVEEPIATLKYSQQQDGAVTLVIDENNGKGPREHSAPSFWHLVLAARGDVDVHLLPILTSLRPGWTIGETADGIEDSLVKLSDLSIQLDRKRWSKLVDELGSPSFQQRRRAERLLREAGPAVVSYLNSLPPDSLDAERKARIQRLLGALASSSDDTPDRIAMWLLDDPTVWLTVLESEDASHRAIGKKQLEALLKQTIQFDANADTKTRTEQIAALRLSIKSK